MAGARGGDPVVAPPEWPPSRRAVYGKLLVGLMGLYPDGAPFVPDARVAIDTMYGCLGTLDEPATFPDPGVYPLPAGMWPPLEDRSQVELEWLAEYVNMDRIPPALPNNAANAEFLGPHHQARFDEVLAHTPGTRVDVAYKGSFFFPIFGNNNPATPKDLPVVADRGGYIDIGLRAQRILYDRARQDAVVEFVRAERTLYESVAISGLAAWIDILLVYVRDNEEVMKFAPRVFYYPPNIPVILEAAGASISSMLVAITGLASRSTRPAARERALVLQMRNFVIAVSNRIEARARGNAAP